ncbi:MAG: hypothetical protein C0609_11765 [Deltaproteobacteria bacterium]|nr:MAG: hypothetical protein C0609_11765 [Deltaproteobacteria bacterium]
MAAKKRKSAVKRRAKKSSAGLYLFTFFLIVGFAIVGGYLYYFSPSTVETLKGEVVRQAKLIKDEFSKEGTEREVVLYYADPKWTRLVPVKREITPAGSAPALAKKLIPMLAQPPGSGEAPPLPEGAAVREVYVGGEGELVVDLEPAFDEVRSWGSAGELLAVYAMVDTLVENIDGVEKVRFLVGGKVSETLAGHILIDDALSPRYDLFNE